MSTLESRRTAFRDSIDRRIADLIVGLEDNKDITEALGLHCFILAHKLRTEGVPSHPILEEPYWNIAFDAMKCGCEKVWGSTPDVEKEPAKWEGVLLAHLSKQVQADAPDLYQIYEQHLPDALRHYAFVKLQDSAKSAELATQLRDYACQNIPITFERLPGNPIRIHRDSTTGKMDLQDIHLATTKHLLEIASLKTIYTGQRTAGRPKGVAKPKGSGRNSIPETDLLSAFEAKQSAKPYQSPPWWHAEHRRRGQQMPSDAKRLEALRKQYEEQALKGRRIKVQGKKSGGLKPT